jgi:purine-cytosine permease-like protein
MKFLLWILVVLSSGYAVFQTIFGLRLATSAPQEAAVAAMGVAFAVIPYCLARAVSELSAEWNSNPGDSQRVSDSAPKKTETQ